MLDYDYPIYKILEEEYPQDMWDTLGLETGMGRVFSVDI